jgi:hypothetical protein
MNSCHEKVSYFDFDRSMSNFHFHSALQDKKIPSNISTHGVVKGLDDGIICRSCNARHTAREHSAWKVSAI